MLPNLAVIPPNQAVSIAYVNITAYLKGYHLIKIFP